jgi:hypothetical protein
MFFSIQTRDSGLRSFTSRFLSRVKRNESRVTKNGFFLETVTERIVFRELPARYRHRDGIRKSISFVSSKALSSIPFSFECFSNTTLERLWQAKKQLSPITSTAAGIIMDDKNV